MILQTFFVLLISLSHALGNVNYGVDEIIPTCTPKNRIGVFDDFGLSTFKDGSTLEEHLQRTYGYVKKKLPLTLQPVVSGGTSFTYGSLHLARDPTYTVGLVTVRVVARGQPLLVDQLRIDPKKWDSFSSAVLGETDEDPDQVRIKYQTVDCHCRERVYGINDRRAWTRACDGADLAGPLAACAPDTGFIKFYAIQIQNFKFIHTRAHLDPDRPSFSLVYGECPSAAGDGRPPVFCLVVKYGGVVVESLGVQAFGDFSWGGVTHRGQDYSQAIQVRELEGSPGSQAQVQVRYLMAGCSCRQRMYAVSASELTVQEDLECPEFAADPAAWSPPT